MERSKRKGVARVEEKYAGLGEKYRVLVTARMFGRLSSEPLEVLEKGGCELVLNPYAGRRLNEGEMLELIKDVDGAIVGEDDLTARVIEAGNRLRVISKFGVGVDRIDVAFATRKGIIVTNTPGTNKNAVADLAFGLILSLARRIPKAHNLVQTGGWEVVAGVEVWGKILGIVGLGQIGRAVALRARGFNMRILGYDIYVDEAALKENGIEFVPLEELLESSDFVTLHVPLSEGTRNLIGRRELALMKETAYLINTSRGGVVDEDALYEALKGGQVAGAALDVFEREPPLGSKLLGLPNLITTPHMGGHTVEAIREMGMVVAENLVRALHGEKPLFCVNPEVMWRDAKSGRDGG